MSESIWEHVMSEMLVDFEQRATFWLRKINKCFEKSSNGSFDDGFRQMFLKMSTEKLAVAYSTVEMQLRWANQRHQNNENQNEGRTQIDGSVGKSLTQAGCSNQPLSGDLESIAQFDVYDNSMGTPRNRDLVKMEAEQPNEHFNNLNNIIEIIESSDEDDVNNQNGDDVEVKEEPNVEPKQEFIDVDIPIRVFRNPDLNDVNAERIHEARGSVGADDVGLNDSLNAGGAVANTNASSSSTRSLSNKSLTQKSRQKDKSAKRLKCQHCEYRTIYKHDLKRHMLTHTGQKPFQCEVCLKRFITSTNLRVHKMLHKNQFPFHCRGCFRDFPLKVERDGHEKVCRRRRYECYLCKKYVTNCKSHMEDHMRGHSGDKPFRCEFCMKRFLSKSNLRYHLNLVHSKTN